MLKGTRKHVLGNAQAQPIYLGRFRIGADVYKKRLVTTSSYNSVKTSSVLETFEVFLWNTRQTYRYFVLTLAQNAHQVPDAR